MSGNYAHTSVNDRKHDPTLTCTDTKHEPVLTCTDRNHKPVLTCTDGRKMMTSWSLEQVVTVNYSVMLEDNSRNTFDLPTKTLINSLGREVM